MESYNVEEYKLIRSELDGLKTCITHYVQMAFGSAGVMVAAYAFAGSKNDPARTSVAAVGVAFVLSLILNVLFYKFHSHNRYAGYCKALAREKFDGIADGVQLHMWEEMVGLLRSSEKKRAHVAAHRDYALESWAFPRHVTAVFAALVVLFCLISFAGLGAVIKDLWSAAVSVVLFVAVLLLWASFAVRLHRLMNAGHTVEDFARNFEEKRRPFLLELRTKGK